MQPCFLNTFIEFYIYIYTWKKVKEHLVFFGHYVCVGLTCTELLNKTRNIIILSMLKYDKHGIGNLIQQSKFRIYQLEQS